MTEHHNEPTATAAREPSCWQLSGEIVGKPITGCVSGSGALIAQYAIRACRIDDRDTVTTTAARIADLHAVIGLATMEIERLHQREPSSPASTATSHIAGSVLVVPGRPARAGSSTESMALPFADDDLAACNEAAELLGLSLERTISYGAAAWSRQLISSHHHTVRP